MLIWNRTGRLQAHNTKPNRLASWLASKGYRGIFKVSKLATHNIQMGDKMADPWPLLKPLLLDIQFNLEFSTQIVGRGHETRNQVVKVLHFLVKKFALCWVHNGQMILSRCQQVLNPNAEARHKVLSK